MSSTNQLYQPKKNVEDSYLKNDHHILVYSFLWPEDECENGKP